MSTTDTPRTDAINTSPMGGYTEMMKLARTLERENARLRDRRMGEAVVRATLTWELAKKGGAK